MRYTFLKQANYALLFAFFLCTNFILHSQENYCATVQLPENIAYIKSKQAELNKLERYYFKHKDELRQSLSEVAVKVHIVRRSNGSGGLTLAQLNNAFSTLNSFYANANMEFQICNGINYIDDDSYYNFDTTQENALTTAHSVSNIINIYFVNDAIYSGNSVCGYAYLPNGPDTIVMVNSCALNGSTLAHEIGHYFNLLHTHGGSNKELVDGTNCSSEGDLICDTPADPKLSYSNVNSSCNYTGTSTDANGAAYTPPISNVMSYSRKNCRIEFTPKQYARIYATFQLERNYITCNTSTLSTTKNETDNLKVYMNANNTHLFVDLKNTSTNTKYSLTNAYGQKVLSGILENNKINTSNLASGVYFLAITFEEGQTMIKKFVN